MNLGPVSRSDRRGKPHRSGPKGTAAIGEIQVGDVPGRREPGTGEINYPAIAALRELEYTGVIGLEGLGEERP